MMRGQGEQRRSERNTESMGWEQVKAEKKERISGAGVVNSPFISWST